MAKNKTYQIAVIGGDGTGPEVLCEGVKVLKAAAAKSNVKPGTGAVKVKRMMSAATKARLSAVAKSRNTMTGGWLTGVGSVTGPGI